MRKITLITLLMAIVATTAMAQEGITISSESNLSQEWTSTGVGTDIENPSYTLWGTDVIESGNYPEGITPSSGNEVHMATTENVTISELGRLKFTFQYTTGGHRLNILGVDLLDGENVVASDYHNGQTGGSNSNNVYTFVAPSGTYTLRYFVEHSTSGNDLRRTNGTITGTLVNVESTKTTACESIESFRNTNMFVSTDIDDAQSAIDFFSPTTAEEYIALEEACVQVKYDLMATINGKCFTLQSFGRSTENGRYLGVTGLNLDGTMNIVATDANELKNIWKFEYVSENKFHLLNIAYDVYAKPIGSFANNAVITTTSSQENAGLYLINPQSDKIALGDREGDALQYFLHETDHSDHKIVRWTATAGASQWAATEVEEPELCSITYNYTLDGVNFRTEKLNVIKGSEYTFVNNYTAQVGMSLNSEIPAAATINEDKIVNYEYVTDLTALPFEAATVTDNRLAQGSKLYKITLRAKAVQLNSAGTDFEYASTGAIENQLFAFVGAPLDGWQIFNYAAGLNKPIWAANNNNNTDFLPTAGVTDKFELVNNNSNYSFKKKGTDAYLHDYEGNFAVWNSSGAYKDDGSYVVFTEATDKEISIATLNIDIKAANHYLSLVDDATNATIKENLTTAISDANNAIADENSTATQIDEIDARVLQYTQELANDMVRTNAESLTNNGVYTFVNSRGWLLYNSANPNVLASSIAYSSLATAEDQPHCQWNIHKSANTGSYYMYNVGAGKFVGDSENAGGTISFVETPTNTVTFYAGTKNGYPIIVSTNNNSAINNYNHGGAPGVANWDAGLSYPSDDGSCHKVTKVALLDETTLANITEVVDIYEAHINKPILLEKITELTTFKESSFLTDEEKETIQAAIDKAQAVYDGDVEKYSVYAVEITELTELKKSLQYLWSLEKLSNNFCYAVSTERGAWYSEVTDDVARLNSTGKLGITYDISEPTQQFAFVKSPTTSNYYIYSVSAKMFVSKDGDYNKLSTDPTESVTFLSSSGSNDYPWVIALNTQTGQWQINITNTRDPGVITFWNDKADQGNRVRLEFAETFNPEEALAAISAYEIATKKEELLAKITEANEYSEKTYLPEDKRNDLSSAATTAQGVYDDENATYENVVEQIGFIEDVLNSCVYVTTPDGFTNTAIYTITAKYNDGNAYIMYDAAQGDNGNYAISSSKFGTLTTGLDVPGCQWALYTSKSGKHYLYNIGANKFMGTSTTANGYIPLNEKPTSSALILKNSADTEYPIMFSVNNGAGVLNHNNGSSFTYGLLNWHSTAGWNDTSSAANVHKVTVVGALDDTTLASIKDLVEIFEKQTELKTLLDNIYTGYYDAYATGDYKWRINTGMNNYSQAADDENFVDAYNDARTYETSEDTVAIQQQIDRMNGLVNNLTINLPEDGKYYRVRCTSGNKYLSSNVNDAGRLQMTASKDASNIFFYTAGGLMSYPKGVYIHAASGSNHIKLRGVEETSTASFVDGKDNNRSGSYLINIKNSDDTGNGRYIHGKNDISDSGSTKPSGGSDFGYNWWLEEVETLPVTITSAGYATFYAPVEVTIPDEVKAYCIKKEGINTTYISLTELDSKVIPAGTGVILEGAANTYDFTITSTGAESITDNQLNGSVAAEYIPEEAYVLALKENAVGLYLTEMNQENSTSFLNNSHKAYLPKSVLTGEASMSAGFRFVFGTTGIEEVISENGKVKGENGEIKAIYDLQGRKLNDMTVPGIYIVNGKKVLVK